MTQQSEYAQPDTGLVDVVQSTKTLALFVKQQECAVVAVLDHRLYMTEQV